MDINVDKMVPGVLPRVLLPPLLLPPLLLLMLPLAGVSAEEQSDTCLNDTDMVEETGTVPKLDPRAEDPGPPPPRQPQSGGLSKFNSGTGAQKDLYIGMFRVDQSVRCADAPLFNVAPLATANALHTGAQWTAGRPEGGGSGHRAGQATGANACEP